MDISVTTLGYIERGEREPSATNLIKLAACFEVSIYTLADMPCAYTNPEMDIERATLNNELAKLNLKQIELLTEVAKSFQK